MFVYCFHQHLDACDKICTMWCLLKIIKVLFCLYDEYYIFLSNIFLFLFLPCLLLLFLETFRFVLFFLVFDVTLYCAYLRSVSCFSSIFPSSSSFFIRFSLSLCMHHDILSECFNLSHTWPRYNKYEMKDIHSFITFMVSNVCFTP